MAYPLASRIAGQDASALGDANDRFGGMGTQRRPAHAGERRRHVESRRRRVFLRGRQGLQPRRGRDYRGPLGHLSRRSGVRDAESRRRGVARKEDRNAGVHKRVPARSRHPRPGERRQPCRGRAGQRRGRRGDRGEPSVPRRHHRARPDQPSERAPDRDSPSGPARRPSASRAPPRFQRGHRRLRLARPTPWPAWRCHRRRAST